MSAHPTLRFEAALKVTGQALFPAETPAEGLLHAVLVEAPIGHGEVLSVDGTHARRMPGFADLVSYPETDTLQPSTATALIRERLIHFPGQSVGLVAAETLQQARAAARAVEVTFHTRPAVTALDQALDQAYAPTMAGRITTDSRRGDAAQAVADAALVVRGRYRTAVNNHHPMEPHAVVCSWDGELATVHTTTQRYLGTSKPVFWMAMYRLLTWREVGMAGVGGGGGDLDVWLLPFLDVLGRKTRRTWAPPLPSWPARPWRAQEPAADGGPVGPLGA